MLNPSIFIVLCLIWGSTWLAIKIGLEGSPPFLGAGFRFVIATLSLYLLTALFRKWDFNFGKLWPKVILAALMIYPTVYGLVYWGSQYVESGLAAVLFATMPFFVAILAHFMIEGERLTFLKIFGMVTGFAGIILIFDDNLGTRGALGILAMIGIAASSFFSAAGTIVTKKYLHDINPLPLTAAQTTIGAIILLAMGLVFEPLADFRTDLKTIGSMLYLALMGTAATFSSISFSCREWRQPGSR